MSVKEIELFKIRDAYKMVSKNNMLRECVCIWSTVGNLFMY